MNDMRMLIYILFCSLSFYSYSQLKRDFIILENNPDLYFLTFYTYIDTSSFAIKNYSNGQKKLEYKFSEDNLPENVTSFFEDGSMACNVKIGCYYSFKSAIDTIKLPNFYKTTYYRSNFTRTVEYNFYLDDKNGFSFKFYNDSSDYPVYNEMVVFNDTICGLFSVGKNYYVEYQNGKKEFLYKIMKSDAGLYNIDSIKYIGQRKNISRRRMKKHESTCQFVEVDYKLILFHFD